jgi:peroxiredoxin Q/BCP
MLKVKDSAAQFSLPDQDGNLTNLSDFKGQWVVLYFYPKALTPGCTTETCNFQESLPQFEGVDAVILGMSKDPVKQQKKFAEKYNVKFKLLSDEKSDTCEKYGVWQKKSMYGKEYMGIARTTFIINPEGKIAKIYEKVKVADHHSEVLEDINSLMK